MLLLLVRALLCLLLLVLVQVVAATVGAVVRPARYKQGAGYGDEPSEAHCAVSRKGPCVSLRALHARSMPVVPRPQAGPPTSNP
jgi:hypothetical protein